MVSFTFGYGYGLRQNCGVARAVITFGQILSANGSPIASANGSVLTF